MNSLQDEELSHPGDGWPFGQRVAILGRLAALPRIVAGAAISARGGTLVERGTRDVDCVVLGADADPLVTHRIDAETRLRIDEGATELIGETEMWQRLGLDRTDSGRGLYTPRMIADTIDVPLRNVRSWVRLGLLSPVRVHYRLPYFDFAALRAAKQIAAWQRSGLSSTSIKSQLQGLLRCAPRTAEAIDHADIHCEGGSLLIRVGGRWMDAAGQWRMLFDGPVGPDQRLDAAKAKSMENAAERADDGDVNADRVAFFGDRFAADDAVASTISIEAFREMDCDEEVEAETERLLQAAEEAEDRGDLAEAIQWLRLLLAGGSPAAEWHFALAELLYRQGDLGAARERYFATLELDEEYVEARMGLGCVLEELGDRLMAIAAFRGVLQQQPDLAEAHYQIARVLEECGDAAAAKEHWQQFLLLAPGSPWADEAIERLREG